MVNTGSNSEGNHKEVLSSLLNNEKCNYKRNTGPRIGKRHIQACMLSVFVIISFTVRTYMSIAIVAMTNPNASPNKDVPTYNWTDQGLILSAFMWGYFIPQSGAGYLADRFGAKWFLTGSSLVSFSAGLLIPLFANLFGSNGVVMLRAIQGVGQGFLYPSLSSIMGKWIPSNEVSVLGTFVLSGAPLGIILSMIITGFISASTYGWPYAFYLFNSLGLIVSLVYSFVGNSDPSSHPTITEEEKSYILSNLKVEPDRAKLSVPFKDIFLSVPFISLNLVCIAFNYTFYTFLTETAIYMDKVMHFNLQSSSLLISLPYVIETISGFLACIIAKFLIDRKLMSVTGIRKLMNNFGLFIPALSLFLLARTGPDDAYLAVGLIIAVTGSIGFGKCGYLINATDLSPNFSGLVMGITNSISMSVAALTPLIAQYFVTDQTDRSQWKIVFYIPLGMNITTGIINTLYTSGEVQYWNQGRKKKEDPKLDSGK